MKKLILVPLLALMLSPVFGYYQICKSNKGPGGYFRVCETHQPNGSGGTAHKLVCEAPGNTPCSWITSPPKGEEEAPCSIIENFVLNKISQNILDGQALFGSANFVVWSATGLNNYTFTVYTVLEAQQLGLLN